MRRIVTVGTGIRALCSKDAHLPEIARRYSIPAVSTDFVQMPEDDCMDAVDIITPPAFHEGMILSAVQAGKDILCEKPLTGCYIPANSSDGFPLSRKHMLEESMYCHAEMCHVPFRQGCRLLRSVSRISHLGRRTYAAPGHRGNHGHPPISGCRS
ncbi:MAG: Gfo/Idh/MocA family oxidoreductase [Clostridia bacterium]|nr:Gfo/Idh/MocA family oxidoreductase [Clostridia bacterium]